MAEPTVYPVGERLPRWAAYVVEVRDDEAGRYLLVPAATVDDAERSLEALAEHPRYRPFGSRPIKPVDRSAERRDATADARDESYERALFEWQQGGL